MNMNSNIRCFQCITVIFAQPFLQIFSPKLFQNKNNSQNVTSIHLPSHLRQTMPTLQQPSMEHSTSTRCRLACSVTVPPFSFQHAWLVRALNERNERFPKLCVGATHRHRRVPCTQQCLCEQRCHHCCCCCSCYCLGCNWRLKKRDVLSDRHANQVRHKTWRKICRGEEKRGGLLTGKRRAVELLGNTTCPQAVRNGVLGQLNFWYWSRWLDRDRPSVGENHSSIVVKTVDALGTRITLLSLGRELANFLGGKGASCCSEESRGREHGFVFLKVVAVWLGYFCVDWDFKQILWNLGMYLYSTDIWPHERIFHAQVWYSRDN